MDKKELSKVLYLHKLGLNLSHVTLISGEIPEKLHKHALYKQLEKKGYVYQGDLTLKGKHLIEEMEAWTSEEVEVPQRKEEKIEYSPGFKSWWNAYPPSDNFTFGNREYRGTRKLKVKQQECYRVWQELTQKISEENLLKALETEVSIRKNKSVAQGKNEMSFMKSTLPYLNSKGFEIYLDVEAQDSSNRHHSIQSFI